MSAARKRRFRYRWLRRLHERTLRPRHRIKKILQRIHERGRMHLTLMFVPHSGRRTVTLRVSHYMVFALVCLLVGTLVGSLVVLNLREADKAQISKLSTQSLDYHDRIRLIGRAVRLTARHFLPLGEAVRSLADTVNRDGGGPLFARLRQAVPADLPAPPPEGLEEDPVLELESLADLALGLSNASEMMEGFMRLNTELNRLRRIIPTGWPIPGGGRMVGPFGYRTDPITFENRLHTGIDLIWFTGAPITATADGEVYAAGEMGAFGEAVLVRHAYGFMTRYAHLLEIKVRRGDRIKQGQLVGLMGNTGRSVGTHLHYEVLIDEVPYDPFHFFAPRALPAVPAED